MSFRKLLTDIKSSLWFTPGLMVVASAVLAFVAVELDTLVGDDITTRYPRLFGAGAEGSRQLLAAIASSTITVSGVVFSITIVALSLAAAQYSPRVLRNFMADRPNQVVLGVFVGVFAYCVLVLRTVRGGENSFIPGLSILIAIALALTGIAFLIFFIHHIATSIQVSEMAARIARETLAASEAVSQSLEKAVQVDDTFHTLQQSAWTVVAAMHTGYIQRVDTMALVSWARKHGRMVRMQKRVGDFVVERETLLCVSGESTLGPEDAESLAAALTVNTYRDLAQDPLFGVQQLVDIAVKALSPGVNDTGTARDALHYISAILLPLARAPSQKFWVHADDGEPRLIARHTSFDEFVELGVAPLRRSSTGNYELTIHLLRSLHLLASHAADRSVSAAIAREVRAIDEAFRRDLIPSTDREMLAAAIRQAVHASGA